MAQILEEYVDLGSNKEELHVCLSIDCGLDDSNSSNDVGNARLPMEHVSDNNINVKEEEPLYKGLAKENELIKAFRAKVQNPNPDSIRRKYMKWDHFLTTCGGGQTQIKWPLYIVISY